MSSTSHGQVELPRLRLHMNVIENLNRALQFVIDYGYDAMKDDNTEYEKWKTTWTNDIGEGAGRGGNLASSIRELGLIDGNTLSTFGQEIFKNWNDQEFVKNAFAKEIIIKNWLWAFCHVLSHLSGRTKDEIFDVYKEYYDSDIGDETQRVGSWKNFLVFLGISTDNYKFNPDEFRRILGISIDEFDKLSELDYNSKWLLLSLIRLSNGQRTAFDTGDVKKMYKRLTGKGIAQVTQSLHAHQASLEDGGWIKTSPPQGGGNERGWTLTDSAITTLTGDILPTLFANPNSPQVLNALSMSYAEIVQQIDNPETNATKKQKGEKLEIFSVKIAWDLGVRNIRMNVLDTMERDVLGNIAHPFFQRILIQCKNHEKPIGMPEIIKEIGIAGSENYDTILFFSRNGFPGGTQADVDNRIQRTGIKIYLFGKEDIDRLIEDGKNLSPIMEEKIRHIEQVMEGTDPVPEGLSRLPDFRDTLREKGWVPPNENTDEHSEPEN